MQGSQSSSRLLTKSRFVLGLRCRKALYFDLFFPQLAGQESSQDVKSRIDGIEVGVYARNLYPEGKLIGSKDIGMALKETQESISNGILTLFEAAFCVDDVVIRADILTRKSIDTPWQLYEVKAATAVKKEWIRDLAIQVFVIQRSGINLDGIYLMHLKSDCSYHNLENVFEVHDCKGQVEVLLPDLHHEIEKMREIFFLKTQPDVDIGPQCEEPQNCPFKDFCWQHIPKYSVFNIPRSRKKWNFYQDNRYTIDLLTENDFTSKTMRRALKCYQTNQLFFDPNAAQKLLQAWKYPLSYFDLESINYPIPRYPKSHPYQQLPFQFSCHIQRTVGSDLEHQEFLYDGIDDPRPAFLRKMLEVLPPSGSIVVYHQEFEVSRLKELANDFPEHGCAIQGIISRVVDLEAVISETTYHPDFLGSFSIKKVAPALLGEKAGYHHLEVSNGVGAMLSYQEMLNMSSSDSRKMEIRKNLLDYCKQDTLLMVHLHCWLCEQIATSAR